jgi:hypothetical protein
VGYLVSLSPDSVPALVAAFQDGKLTPATRDAAGAVIACRIFNEQGRNSNLNWRGFMLSRWWANQALAQVQDLNNYTILDKDYPAQVQTPLGKIYDCSSTTMN